MLIQIYNMWHKILNYLFLNLKFYEVHQGQTKYKEKEKKIQHY